MTKFFTFGQQTIRQYCHELTANDYGIRLTKMYEPDGSYDTQPSVQIRDNATILRL